MPKKNPVTKPAAKPAPTKKPAAKTTAKKAPVKKAAPKKAPVKKSAAKSTTTARGGKPGPRQPKLDISELHNPAANQVRKLRGEMSQPEFAEKSGLKYAPAVARIENPEYLSTSTSTLLRIAKSLGKKLVIGFIDEDAESPFPEYTPPEPAPKADTEDDKGAPAKKATAKKAPAKKPAAKKAPARKAPVRKKTAAKKPAAAKKAPARRKTAAKKA